MSTKIRLLVGAGTAAALALALAVGVAGFWVVSGAFAQSAAVAPGDVQGSCHDNQPVFKLLGLSQPELLAQRQAGTSLFDVATSKGVDEAKLTNALVQPMYGMHETQTNSDQMHQQMRNQFAKDIRESKFGTMTDLHLGLGGDGAGNMMSGANGQGMLGGADGKGIMDNTNHDGMMNGAGGMMGNWKP